MVAKATVDSGKFFGGELFPSYVITDVDGGQRHVCATADDRAWVQDVAMGTT
jgi:hypothetical protein